MSSDPASRRDVARRARPLAPATLAACALACTPPPEPTDPTWEGEFLVDQVLIECDGVDDWDYDVVTIGWGEAVTVDIVARGPGTLWTEHHDLPEVERGEDWSRHHLHLDQAYSEADYAPSQATLVACDAKTLVTYGFATWRTAGELEECIAWGIDPTGEFPDCANWGANGH